jgi:pseudouridine-5'-phosphate glycosidase
VVASPLPESAIRLTADVQRARDAGRPVVALESSVLAQGLPIPANAEAARRMTRAVESSGAVAAVTAVVRGTPTAGLTTDELARFLARDGVMKAAARELPVAMARGVDAATTVAASLVVCHASGIQVLATGGIGGVHRGLPRDESADLIELSRTPVIAVCAGAKSILDIPATLERLETLGVTIVGFRTAEFPGFFYESTGLPLGVVANDVDDIVSIFRNQRRLGMPAALLVVQRPPAADALRRELVDDAVQGALREADEAGVTGSAVTPFLLAAIERATGGRSLTVNLALLEANARLAGEIACALSMRGH